MILITGPSGNVGHEPVDLLLEAPTDRRVRVTNRHPDR
jgi:uncharacterized protein YbjT (DUF2867 family)